VKGSPQVERTKKPLAPRRFVAKTKQEVIAIAAPEMPLHPKGLACPYSRCGKRFEQPLVLTDFSKTPRETYYACPYCFSRVEIAFQRQGNLNSVSVKTSENADVRTPEECSHYLGYLKILPQGDSIPDACLTCAKLIQCTVKK
jgi:DNA-directed RNA polymerase subunit RPC12/RpoP